MDNIQKYQILFDAKYIPWDFNEYLLVNLEEQLKKTNTKKQLKKTDIKRQSNTITLNKFNEIVIRSIFNTKLNIGG